MVCVFCRHTRICIGRIPCGHRFCLDVGVEQSWADWLCCCRPADRWVTPLSLDLQHGRAGPVVMGGVSSLRMATPQAMAWAPLRGGPGQPMRLPRPVQGRARAPVSAVPRPVVFRTGPPVRGAAVSEDQRRRDAAGGLLRLAQGGAAVPGGSRLPRPVGPVPRAPGAVPRAPGAAPRVRAGVRRGSRLPRPDPSRQE